MKGANAAGAAIAAGVAAGLLLKTDAVAAGVRAGLVNCAEIVIPALFPFMILAGLIGSTGAGRVLSRAVSAVAKRVIGLPETLGAVLLMSFVGGFPVGARMLAKMVERREIDGETAGRALCCCVNAGPSFLVSAVGAGMLHSRTAGFALLAAQMVSSLLIGAILFRGGSHTAERTVPHSKPAEGDAFVGAVRDASAGILSVCAFIVAFAALTSLLNALGVTEMLSQLLGRIFPALGVPFFGCFFTGVLEVTGGCALACTLSGSRGLLLCAFFVSFSSLSIIFQVRACFPDGCGVKFGRFYRSRLLHGALTTLMVSLLVPFLPSGTLAVSAGAVPPLAHTAPNMPITALCLIGMCTLVVFPPKNPSC